MTSIRAFARGHAATAPLPQDGIETVLQMRDRLNALIACGESSTLVKGTIAVDGHDVSIGEYAALAATLKAERLKRRLAVSSTHGELIAAFEAMTPEQQQLPLKVEIPGARGTRILKASIGSRMTGDFTEISGYKPNRTQLNTPWFRSHHRDYTPFRYLRLLEQPHVTPEMLHLDHKMLIRISTSENTDSLISFDVSAIEIADDHILLKAGS